MTYTPTLENPPLQAQLWESSGDPWRVLVACQLLNVTTRRQVDEVLPDVFDRWSRAYWMSKAVPGFLAAVIEPLGLADQRARRLIDLSAAWVVQAESRAFPLNVLTLPGIGSYGQASYDLFVRGRLAAGSRTSDRVVRAWVQLAASERLELCHHCRAWTPRTSRGGCPACARHIPRRGPTAAASLTPR